MNAKIEQRHRQRLADLYNEHQSVKGWYASDFCERQADLSDRMALQVIANADAAARERWQRGDTWLADDKLAALICPDDTPDEPKEKATWDTMDTRTGVEPKEPPVPMSDEIERVAKAIARRTYATIKCNLDCDDWENMPDNPIRNTYRLAAKEAIAALRPDTPPVEAVEPRFETGPAKWIDPGVADLTAALGESTPDPFVEAAEEAFLLEARRLVECTIHWSPQTDRDLQSGKNDGTAEMKIALAALHRGAELGAAREREEWKRIVLDYANSRSDHLNTRTRDDG